jgi:hypothetical protein
MGARRWKFTAGIALLTGIVLGWVSAGGGGRNLLAQRSDRWGDWVLASGPIHLQDNPQYRAPIPQDAIYYLNYKTGQLLASVPTMRQTAEGFQALGDFAERDLVADFGLTAGDSPHFLMTTCSLGARSEGWSPLFVFETTSGQVATYKVQYLATAGSTKPVFQLLELRTDARLGRGLPKR